MNLNIELKKIISNIDINDKPNLFLHVCCCPCSSHIIINLIQYFNIYIIFYNPNIDTKEEFDRRLLELKRFLDIIKLENSDLPNIPILYDEYNHDEFLEYIKGYEQCKEGGDRCIKCFELRISKTYKIAIEYIQKNSIKIGKKNLEISENYICSSLTTSPHKDPIVIYDIACRFNDDMVKYLPSDFKKNDGYLNSIRICKKYNIYRQNYCGCEFSKGG